MLTQRRVGERPDRLTDSVRSDRRLAGGAVHAERDRAYGDALLAQLAARVGAALIAGFVQFAVLGALPGQGSAHVLADVVAAYLVVVIGAGALVRWQGRATPGVVTAVLALDLAFIFVATVATTTPAHYERALFATLVVLHVANFSFGRRHAWRVGALAFVGYIALIVSAAHRGLAIDVVEEIWTLGIALVGTLLVLAQAAHIRARLRTLVTLFEHAEQGDFTHTYDEGGVQRYDAITRVGRAYNRVRVQLASMVLSDALTGCLNRRGFEQALAREVSRASRSGGDLALLVLDLDHFKLVNDTYGHPAGDEVLRTLGRLLLQTARGGDIVARLGGEEFDILLPATGSDGALHFATRLCELVRAHPFAAGSPGAAIRVTTSAGVAAVAPRNSRDSGGDADVLARRADMALYAAKRTGRDRARQWDAQLDLTRAASALESNDALSMGLA